MFLGEYQHSLDAKGRIILPVAFRGLLAQGCILTKGQDGCLAVYPKQEWQQISDRLRDSMRSDKNARNFLRVWYASAREEELDKQGRVTVPEHLRTYAGLDRDVSIIGAGERAEIWDRDRWQRVNGEAEQRYSELDEANPNLPY